MCVTFYLLQIHVWRDDYENLLHLASTIGDDHLLIQLKDAPISYTYIPFRSPLNTYGF